MLERWETWELATAVMQRVEESKFGDVVQRRLEGWRLYRRRMPARPLLAILSGRYLSTRPLELVKRWVASNPTGILVLSGSAGCGKSVAAAWWAVRMRGQWDQASYWGTVEFNSLRSEIERTIEAPILVLDDVGDRASSSHIVAERISQILVRRHAMLLPTLITTNLQPDGFARLLDGPGVSLEGSRILDRIREDGGFVNVSGESLRKHDHRFDQSIVHQWEAEQALVERVDAVAARRVEDRECVMQLARLVGLSDVELDELADRVMKARRECVDLMEKLGAKMRAGLAGEE